MNKPTPPDDSLGDFIREAFEDHAAGVSQEPEEPTMMMDGEQREATLGALPGHEVEGFIARAGWARCIARGRRRWSARSTGGGNFTVIWEPESLRE